MFSRHRARPSYKYLLTFIFLANLGILTLLLSLSSAWADKIETDVILEIKMPRGPNHNFTYADFSQLPISEYETSTVWTESVDRYAGVLLIDLLRHLGFDPAVGTVSVYAIDGYSAVINSNIISEQAPLLAFLRNDIPMSIRNQGPIWLIFPYDSDQKYRTETIYAMSVWQIRSLRVQQ